ncbi:hypothetical protein LO762_15980 [Actinocorallia sp. API 0066]|uniref:hypothetical protein n=1 Tax=Actinocorallia sp. API 0066 TaxID=2896846 RepID=UPI001E2A2A47|nr:hypothetical protein [Actinocorallia sp. API 0066]MCD0450677.1 hypothetical protein [Actinocorallia sp. API 0066]
MDATPRRMNPFDTSPEAGHLPLCPWRLAAHERDYVPVDHSFQAYEKFKGAISGDPFTTGWLFVFKGPSGCGKTALMHRCAHWLQRAGETSGGYKAEIIDFTDQVPPTFEALPVERRVAFVARRVARRVGQFLGRPLRPGPPDLLYAAMSDLLLAQDEEDRRLVLVLLPPSELAAELDHYRYLGRPGLVFMAETSTDETDPAATLTSRYGLRTVPLEVRGLSPGDGWKLVRARMRGGATPRFPRALVDSYMTAMAGRSRDGISIKELRSVLAGAYAVAVARAHTTVSEEDLLDSYLGGA